MDKFWIWLAWHLPVRLVYWCVIRAAVKVEPQEYPGDKTAREMLCMLDGPRPFGRG